MGFFSGLAKPASSGVEGFLAALRDKLDRDRLLAAQAIVQGDPAAAMQIRARSQANDAQRAEAKERARAQRTVGYGWQSGGQAPTPLDDSNSDIRSPVHLASQGLPIPWPARDDQPFAPGRSNAGSGVGSAMVPEALAHFKPPPETEDPAASARIYEQKVRRIGGLNGVGYIPRPEDYDTLARIIYAESLDHPGDFGAIGWSTINRVGREGYQPTLDEVLHADNQFAIVREGNQQGVDAPLWIESASPERLRGDRRDRWLTARKVAHGILDGQLPDPTGGATRFFASRDYHTGGTAPGDFPRALRDGIIRPSKYRTTARSGRRQYFFEETAPPRPISPRR